MGVLPQLVEPAVYRPCDWDLKADDAARGDWVDLFCRHLELVLRLIREKYPSAEPRQIDAFRRDYLETMRLVGRAPERFQRVDILLLTELRRDVLNRHRFPDPFRGVKERENAAALRLLPGLLAELDELPAPEQSAALARGLMAGNIFDLGSLPTVERYGNAETEFRAARAGLPPRPWFIDDLDRWGRRWERGAGYRYVLLFTDNAGSDICLGCLPLVRWMVQHGACVTLAANSGPALNDVTAGELTSLFDQVARIDPILERAHAEGRLHVVASGSTTPLLDLTALSAECVAAAGPADLLLLHGMGRSVESNAPARFTCDVLRTAMLKDPAVARRVGGKLFDCCFDYRPAAGHSERERGI